MQHRRESLIQLVVGSHNYLIGKKKAYKLIGLELR